MLARTPTTRPRGHLARGALLSLLLHGQLLVPLVVATFFLANREEAQKAEEVDVAFEDVKPEELPHDLPPLDDTPPPVDQARRRRPERPKTRDEKKPAEVKKPEPKPDAPKPPEEHVEKPVAPPPPAATPPPPPPPPKQHEKSVDLDNDKEVEAPKDAKLLAQKNNRAEVETRAEKTNLERAQKGEEASASDQPAPHPRDDSPGDSKNKIADLDDVHSRAGKAAPEDTPHQDTDSAPTPTDEPMRSPVLSLRSVSPRGHEITPETVDPSLPRDPAGILAAPARHGAFADDEADLEHTRSGKKVRLALSGKDYEYLFGAESKADRQLAEKTRSTRMGKFARRTAQIRSALENFLPEVRPGNQTALNTRAAPFAAFIAHMHRNIHKLWGFGALEEWDELPRSSPFNNESLLTTVEIVLAGDGTIDKVSVIQASGYVAYDAAAVDTVYSAGPYPDPPAVIRSGNGKIYIHWRFFRDGRQCATSGVDYFILDNAGEAADTAHASSAPAAGAGGGRAATAAASGPGRGSAGAAASAATEIAAPAPLVNPPQVLPDQNAGARVARAWFASYTRGDVDGLTASAVFPFRTSLNAAVKSRDELSDLLRGLLAESPHRSIGNLSVDTGGGLRRQIGKLPGGLDDGSGALFALAQADGDTLVLILKKTQRGWQPQGLIRL